MSAKRDGKQRGEKEGGAESKGSCEEKGKEPSGHEIECPLMELDGKLAFKTGEERSSHPRR